MFTRHIYFWAGAPVLKAIFNRSEAEFSIHMRPCNLCRKPVENGEMLCGNCSSIEVERLADEAKKIRLTQPEHNVEESELLADYSYAIVMAVFCVVVTGIFALVGAAINGSPGFLWGCLIGGILGTVVFSVAIRM
ncbi:MAG: hypothetical protein GY880_15595 [Planctomycetaceae bacterium]|nr:hypothetical protein [Planctomycetaceae bacterium]MCP4775655.1 hypothetical protein [Planctomycetaceae bacterium]